MATQKPVSQMQIFEIFQHVQMQTREQDKITILQHAGKHNPQLKRLLKSAYDSNVKWLIPEGDVPYNKNSNDGTIRLEKAVAKLHYMVEGGYPNMKQGRRETIFIQFLEALEPHNVDILLHAKEQKLHELYTSLTPSLIQKAFPELLQEPIKDSRKSTKAKPGPKKGSTNKKQEGSNTKASQGKQEEPKETEVQTEDEYVDPEIEKLDPNPTDED